METSRTTMLPNTIRLRAGSLRGAQRHHLGRLLRSAAPVKEQSLHVLPGRDQQDFGVHFLQLPEPESPHAVPVLSLREERLDPHRAFPQGLAVGFGVAVSTHPSKVLLF